MSVSPKLSHCFCNGVVSVVFSPYSCVLLYCLFSLTSHLRLCSLCVFCSFVVTTPTITQRTVSALKMPDNPSGSASLSLFLKIDSRSLLCVVQQLSVWMVQRLFHINLHFIT